MRSYLVLEDGSLYEGISYEKGNNILGQILLEDQGNISVYCNITGKRGSIVSDLDSEKGNLVLSQADFESLKEKIQKNKILQGKIVSDSMPLEYHVYDVKTFIPVII